MESKNRRGDDRRIAAQALRRAQMCLRDGDNAAAIVLTEKLLGDDPSHLGALEIQAKAQWKGGQYEPLLLTLQDLIRVNPYESGYHALRGAALQCLGRYGEATKAMERVEDSPEAAARIRDLQGWQSDLVIEMSRTDPVLRAHLRQNAAAACAARGFKIPAVRPLRAVARVAEPTSVQQRPS
ncbi:hypothetical protein OP10G_1627 [Fimbriimonas ginsengisoli Gsoil 348]|uniref:Tetratricopeptide repeat protein n=2 Tax=Fimbriimonas ginsengisoli TaxID=1005039 RepID=A0A068NQH6_FIMGI|nr:hypothetical protein OP10G_1627 [Fimbriimonas ginsengisoli Gsoil 348]